jgi:glycogen(starch) synthase
MRILMTTDTVGGVWTFTKQLCWELLARGNHVALVSVGRSPSQAQAKSMNVLAARWGEQFCFTPSAAPLEWMDNNDCAYDEVAPLLLQTAEVFAADLLLSSQYCFGALPFTGPRIVIAHSDVLSWAKECRCERLPPSPWLERYCALAREGLECADAVVAPTRWMLHALEENFPIPGELHVIYNGRTINQPHNNEMRRMQAVAAGRLWDEAKNIQLLAETALPLPILIAGDSAGAPASFRRASEDAKLLGPLDEEEILALFRQSIIYVCASKYEPFGLAPLEAALCGCAVVANNIPSLREVWGDAALYFDDADSLSALLAHLSRSDWALTAARKQARWRASHFTASRMAEGYLELFRSFLSRTAGRYDA